MEMYILSAIIIVLLIAVIVLLIKRSGKDDARQQLSSLSGMIQAADTRVGQEFARSREEMTSSQHLINETINTRLNEMTEKINTLTVTNLEQQNKINENVSLKLENIRKSNEQKLDQMRETVDEKLTKTLSSRLDGSFKQVSQQLENVYKSLGEVKTLSGGVTESMSNFSRVLTNVKTRGTWAEIQLGNILDQTIPGMYETNVETVAGSGERVEFAIKVPAENGQVIYLPVDSKFPMESYVRLLSASDSGDKALLDAARKELEKNVELQAKKVTKYINVPNTTPFAVLYLATEGLYAELAASKNGINEKLQSKYKIMLAGPSTVTALLNSMAMGFKTMAINKKADEIARSLAAAKAQYSKFSDVLDAAVKNIENAGKKVNEAKKRNDIINKKLKQFENFEENGGAFELPETEV